MSGPRPAALALGAVVLVLVVELLRRRQLREKFAAVWLGIGVAAVVVAVSPSLLDRATHALGFAIPANLLFFVGTLVLMVISMQLSLELGRMDDKARRLAEEVALLRLDLQRLAQHTGERSRDSDRPGGHEASPSAGAAHGSRRRSPEVGSAEVRE